MNKLVKKVSKEQLIPEFLQALNGILGLTDRELQLMTLLIKLDIEYDKSKELKNVADADNRKLIMKELHITKDNLSRYIKAFREKGLLHHGKYDGELHVNEALIPMIIGDRLQLTIVLKIAKDV